MGGLSQVQLDSNVIDRRTNAPLVRVSNLNVMFKSQHGIIMRASSIIKSVDGVSFDINDSEIVSIVGESGSGKSTIARCLMVLLRPSSGSIRFENNETVGIKGKKLLKYRRQVQMIFQDPFESINPRDDVFTTISTPIRRLYGERDKKNLQVMVANLLMEVNLDPETIMNRYPHQLSGGQRQRVNIARALAPNPKLVIADEPITMLDAGQRLRVLHLLKRLKLRRNLTILMITHDLASAKLMSDRTLVMYRGKIVESGKSDAVLTRPHHPYTELILESMPTLQPEKETPFLSFSLERESEKLGSHCVFQSRCKYAAELCKVKEPLLEEKTQSHFAACHFPINE